MYLARLNNPGLTRRIDLMSNPTAFIFDLDGVITDTAEYHYLAWKRLADEEGISFSREDNDKLRGISRRASLLIVLKDRMLPEHEMELLMARKNEYYRALLVRLNPNDLLPGVGPLLQEAKARGIKLGVASASKNARQVLTSLGIFDMFGAIADGNAVINIKPAPDLFIWAAGRLDVHPAQVVVFEDAEAGVEAARAAGMYVVGLGPAARVGKAHLVLPGLENVRIAQIFESLPLQPQLPSAQRIY
jgi:kojibiose phosphorylase